MCVPANNFDLRLMKNTHLLVALILRHCDVLPRTPYSSGFRAPCIWALLISPNEPTFLKTRQGESMNWEYIISAIIGLGLLVYLTYALLKPEQLLTRMAVFISPTRRK